MKLPNFNSNFHVLHLRILSLCMLKTSHQVHWSF